MASRMTWYPQSICRDKYSILQVDFVDNKINRLHSKQVSCLHSHIKHIFYELLTNNSLLSVFIHFCLHKIKTKIQNCTNKRRSTSSHFIIQLFWSLFYFINFKQHVAVATHPLKSPSSLRILLRDPKLGCG